MQYNRPCALYKQHSLRTRNSLRLIVLMFCSSQRGQPPDKEQMQLHISCKVHVLYSKDTLYVPLCIGHAHIPAANGHMINKHSRYSKSVFNNKIGTTVFKSA